MRRATAVAPVALVALLVTSGCGSDEPPATISFPAPTPTATATDQTTMLPSGWPDQVQLPDGASITSSSNDARRLTVTFQTPDLGKSVADFFDKEITAAGYQKGDSGTSGDTLTVDYTNGAQDLVLAIVETAGDTTGTLTLTSR